MGTDKGCSARTSSALQEFKVVFLKAREKSRNMLVKRHSAWQEEEQHNTRGSCTSRTSYF